MNKLQYTISKSDDGTIFIGNLINGKAEGHGWLISEPKYVGDFKNMANNALKMLSNEHQLNKFKANALKQAQKFDVKKILPLYEKLYEDCIEGHFNK